MAVLPTPASGDVWGAQTNAAVESLHQRGDHASMPLSNNVLNSLYYCTTHDAWLRWDGSAWQPHSRGGSSERLWVAGSSETSIDEFNDGSLDSAWVRVDSTTGAGRATWTEDGDVLSAANTGGDASSELHALMRPLSGMGGALAAGDAIITCVSLFGSRYTNYTMGGLVLADGVTYGSGTQLVNLSYINASNQANDLRPMTGFNTQPASPTTQVTVNTSQQFQTFLRIVMLGTNSWRLDVSPDGVGWVKGSAYARTVAPTHVGLYCSSWGTSTKGVSSFRFFRRASGVT